MIGKAYVAILTLRHPAAGTTLHHRSKPTTVLKENHLFFLFQSLFQMCIRDRCIAMTMPAQAQIHFGVKGGLNFSKASFSNVSENFKKDNFTGFFIGPMAEFNIPIVGLGAVSYTHLIDKNTGKIVGCMLFAPDAGEVINIVAMAMKTGQDYTFLRDFI